MHLTADGFMSTLMGRDVYLALKIVATLATLSLSALISGLHLALMSMDIIELKCVTNAGTPTERMYASRILPVREKSNYLLSSLDLAAVACDSATTLLIGSMTSDWIALLVSTLLTTIFSGIIPEAVTYRHGLMIGGNTMFLTYFLLIATFPLSYPIAKLMDCMIGEDIGHIKNRKYLSAYIELTSKENALCPMEVLAVKGTLALQDKTVKSIMTPIKDVFMMDIESVIDQQLFMQILETGYSRIPVYEGSKNNIIGLLHIKELAAVFATKLDKPITISQLMESVKRELIFVSGETPLSKEYLMGQFKRGTHLALVTENIINQKTGKLSRIKRLNPFSSKESNLPPSSSRHVIGVITLEDIIEEILQTEIIDETDTIIDNKYREKRKGLIYAQEVLKKLNDLEKSNNDKRLSTNTQVA